MQAQPVADRRAQEGEQAKSRQAEPLLCTYGIGAKGGGLMLGRPEPKGRPGATRTMPQKRMPACGAKQRWMLLMAVRLQPVPGGPGTTQLQKPAASAPLH